MASSGDNQVSKKEHSIPRVDTDRVPAQRGMSVPQLVEGLRVPGSQEKCGAGRKGDRESKGS